MPLTGERVTTILCQAITTEGNRVFTGTETGAPPHLQVLESRHHQVGVIAGHQQCDTRCNPIIFQDFGGRYRNQRGFEGFEVEGLFPQPAKRSPARHAVK